MKNPLGNFIEKLGCEALKDFAFSASITTLQLSPEQIFARVSGAVIAGTVYLPPVSQCAGRIFTVIASSVATGNVTVVPYNSTGGLDDSVVYGSGGAVASFVLASAEAHVCLYSTGERWIVLQFDLSV